MKKYVLMLLVFVFTSSCCMFENTPYPVWFPPQPIDSLLLGSGICNSTIVTFSRNNECTIRYEGKEGSYESLNWYVSGGVLVIPPSFDRRTKHFPEYNYRFEDEKLQLEFVSHPFLGCGPGEMKPVISPLNTDGKPFTKLEE